MDSHSVKNIMVFQHDAALYGASQSLLTLLEYLVKKSDVQILVLLPKKGLLEDRLTVIGVHFEIIRIPRCITVKGISVMEKIRRTVRYFKEEGKVLPELIRLAREFRPDLIYSNTSAVSIGYKLSRRLRIPHIWHVREFGDIDFQYLPNRAFVNRQMLKSEAVIFVSRSVKSQWVKSENDKFKVVYNGIASVKDVVPRMKPSGSKWRFGCIGPLIPKKGQDVAVEAFLRLLPSNPECELHLFGGKEDLHFVRSLELQIAQQGGRENVFFHNFVVDNRSIYDALDVVLCCAINEAFGRTLIEAMSHGILVIANAKGGPVEIIDDGHSGLLYNATPEDLLSKIQLLMSDDRLYENISKNAIATYQKKFNLQDYVAHVERILMEAAAPAKRY